MICSNMIDQKWILEKKWKWLKNQLWLEWGMEFLCENIFLVRSEFYWTFISLISCYAIKFGALFGPWRPWKLNCCKRMLNFNEKIYYSVVFHFLNLIKKFHIFSVLLNTWISFHFFKLLKNENKLLLDCLSPPKCIKEIFIVCQIFR